MNSHAHCTFIIPCSLMQANSAKYALNLIKRIAMNSRFFKELSVREMSISNLIVKELVSSDGQFSAYHSENADDLRRYCLGFNFMSEVVNTNKVTGLMLRFSDCDSKDSLYAFSPLNAALFTQAVLSVCGLEHRVEIIYHQLSVNQSPIAGCFTVDKNELDHLSLTELLNNAGVERQFDHYIITLATQDNLPPFSILYRCNKNGDPKKLLSHAMKKHGSLDSTINSFINKAKNKQSYSVKKLCVFDFKILEKYIPSFK
ncbi:hypothetical protein [Yersinia pseudotuberculosis]|uniref:hypothetical protein n=1 Tax=Yersinia pseudotuberculosis TaxID=633 RepID=UPI0005E1CBF0|nr:hypothetical protein [Yersinia pseudotuberculosis]CND59508.1 Uncharacterised protein [Yersinia pseudotuberculosis]